LCNCYRRRSAQRFLDWVECSRGESDQNLILLDGFPIYNPFHLGGLFSTFIDPTVRDVTLMTAAFRRGTARLSSVLDVRSSEEVRSGVHGSAELSVLASTEHSVVPSPMERQRG